MPDARVYLRTICICRTPGSISGPFACARRQGLSPDPLHVPDARVYLRTLCMCPTPGSIPGPFACAGCQGLSPDPLHVPDARVYLRILCIRSGHVTSSFEKFLSWIPSKCQTVWTHIRPDDSSGLIWVQTVCQVYEQTTLGNKELKDLPHPN